MRYRLPHPSISRRHAEVAVSGSTITVRDLNSHNGTFVDGQRIQSSSVLSGQKLHFGAIQFAVYIDDVDAEADEDGLETLSVNQQAASTGDLVHLSAAQREVLDLLLEGLSEKQIAVQLDNSHHTVHNHVREIYRLLQVHSRPELLARFLPHNGEDRTALT